jgi:hypothetical protein
METISYQYQITENDYLDYYKLVFYEEKGFNKLPFLVVLCFLWMLYVLIKPALLTIIILIAFILIILFFLFLSPLLIKYLAKRLYDKKTYLHQVNDFYINNDEVIVKNNQAQSLIKWENLIKVTESKLNIYCLFNNNQVLMIPKTKVDMELINHLIKR